MQVMSLAFNGFGILRNLRNLACRLCLWHLMGSEIRGNRDLAIRQCLWHWMGSEILRILRILRAGDVSGILWVWKS